MTGDEPVAGADVVVVGGGVAGVSAAAELATAGADVVVLEALAPGRLRV